MFDVELDEDDVVVGGFGSSVSSGSLSQLIFKSSSSDVFPLRVSLFLHRNSPHRRRATSIGDASTLSSSTHSPFSSPFPKAHKSISHRRTSSIVLPTLSNLLHPDPSHSPVSTPPTTPPPTALNHNLSFTFPRSPFIPTSSNCFPKETIILEQATSKVQNFGSPLNDATSEESLVVSIRRGGATTVDLVVMEGEQEAELATKLENAAGKVVGRAVGWSEPKKINQQHRRAPSLPSISVQPPTPLPLPLSYRSSEIELLNTKSPSPPPLPPFYSSTSSLDPLSPIRAAMVHRRPQSQVQPSPTTLGRVRSTTKHPRSVSTAEGDQGNCKKGREGRGEDFERRVVEEGWFQVSRVNAQSVFFARWHDGTLNPALRFLGSRRDDESPRVNFAGRGTRFDRSNRVVLRFSFE